MRPENDRLTTDLHAGMHRNKDFNDIWMGKVFDQS